MTTIYHDPIVPGQNNGADTWNAPMGQIDAALAALSGNLQSQINNVIINDGTANAEVSAARVRIPYGDAPAVLGDTIEYLGGAVANVLAFGAVGDGVTDDSAAIQDAVDAAQLVYLPPGDYLCNDVVIPANVTLYGRGGVTLLTNVPGVGVASHHCLKIEGSNVTLRGLSITGNDGDENGVLINLEAGNLDNVRIEQCKFTNLNFCIRIKSYTAASRTASNIFVTDCHFQDILGYRTIDLAMDVQPEAGVAYTLENIRIERNTFIDCAPESSGLQFQGCVYINDLTSIARFYLCDNIVYRVAPLFLRIGQNNEPHIDFVIRGNTVRMEGPANEVRMAYEIINVDNLIFSDNSTYYVVYECLLLQNCRNVKITNCHFEDANIGISVSDSSAVRQRTNGEITNCTFVDCECPTSENSANVGIAVESDGCDLDISNCRFSTVNGNKGHGGIDVAYENSPPRWSRSFGTTAPADFVWTSAGSSTYYLQRVGAANPRISLPVAVYETDVALAAGTLGALTASQWAFGDNNTLGYDTLYVRLSDGAAPTNNEVSVGWGRFAITVTNCRFEQITLGVIVRTGGTAYPGHARVVNCSFSRCTTGVQFIRALGNVVMGCSFVGNTTDVIVTTDTEALRCIANFHQNTNSRASATAGAYVIALENGASDKRMYSITDCTFRNVKNMHINHATPGGTLSGRLRMLIWRDNDVDTLSTGLPAGLGVITALTSAQKILGQNTILPTSGSLYESGDLILHTDPALGDTIGFMGVGAGFANVATIRGQAGNLSGAVSPVGVAAAAYIGQTYFDTAATDFYISTVAGTPGTWKKLTP